ncbi:MAG: hypothetical protein QXH27_00425 [Candidatus Micrarchaeia archaeon]
MRAGKRGFVFTVDAFIALLLVLLTVFALIALLSFPRAFLGQYEQTHDLARDSLNALDALGMNEIWGSPQSGVWDRLNPRDRNNSVLEELARLAATGDYASAEFILRSTLDPVIPPQYNYRFEYFDVGANGWRAVSGRPPYEGASVQRMQAVASRVITTYAFYDEPGRSPFSYTSGAYVGSCQGIEGEPGAVPCEARNRSGFAAGTLAGPTSVRLVVWI